MQRIVLKKEIKTKYPIEGISLVNLEDEIDYKSSKDGIYASGVIKLSGEYYKGIRNTRFNDEIDVDIFASFDDLVSRNELRINIIDFDYTINDDVIMFSVIIDILGLKEVKKSFPTSDMQEEIQVVDRAGNDNSDLVLEETKDDEKLEIDIKEETVPNMEVKNTKEEKKQTRINNQVCWSFYVVLEGDNYESISNDLNINVDKLKSLNKNKELSVGTLLVLPK